MAMVFSKETRKRMSISAKKRCTPEWRKRKSDMYSTKLPLDELREFYEGGMTQDEIALVYGVTQKTIWGAMRRNGMPRRMPVKRDQTGENNDSWKGDSASYKGFHSRLYTMLGRPTYCEVCGRRRGSRSRKYFQWANLTGKFNDPKDYKRMCARCHMKYDKRGAYGKRDKKGRFQKGGDNYA